MKAYIYIIAFLLFSCQSKGDKAANQSTSTIDVAVQNLDTATFAGGCFWCIEASFEQIKGVSEAISGYAGGEASTADYKKVSAGLTKHAETVQIYFDPTIIDYKTLLDIFFVAHDPTQVDRQGPDVGPQYRSVIFYHNDSQKKAAEEKIKSSSSVYTKPIATEVRVFDTFYPAEAYHQDYERRNPNNTYIRNVSRPKIEKVAKTFKHLLKS